MIVRDSCWEHLRRRHAEAVHRFLATLHVQRDSILTCAKLNSRKRVRSPLAARALISQRSSAMYVTAHALGRAQV